MLALAWIGTVPGWLTLAALIMLALTLRGSQLGPAIGYYKEANEALTKEVTELKDRLANELKENAALRASRDLTPLQTVILDTLAQHEERAAERFEKSITILDLIAARLGPNSEH